MTLCPVAIAVGCKKCPVFGICPLKGVIGDFTNNQSGQAPEKNEAKGSKKARKK